MASFPKTARTSVTRLPRRGTHDQETIYNILDEALYCTVAFVHQGQPFQFPTGFCRLGDKLYIHGSVGSHWMRQLSTERPTVCISATLIDGMVLARSAFHHSVNYRSVVLFSQPVTVTDEETLYGSLEAFTNKMQPGRWDDVRKPTPNEWKATMVLSFSIEEASAKVRTGPPKDDEDDYALPVWAGVVPLQLQRLTPIADPALPAGTPLPDYLSCANDITGIPPDA